MENQKTKRKFNIIDIIFIVVIVVALVAVGIKFFGDSQTARSSNEYIVTFHTDDAPTDAITPVKVGDTVIDETGNIVLGKVENVTVGESRVYTTNSEGQMLTSVKEGYSSADITVRITATGTSNYITVGGTKYSINHGMTTRVGMTKLYLRIIDIQPAE